MNKKIVSTVSVLSLLLTACASTPEPELTESDVTKFDYPTRDRVEYVFNCIAQHGGKLDYITQYACGCKIDKIAERLTFEEYEAATTFGYLRKTPGESGSVFRDPQQAKDLRKQLKEAEDYAESQCFVK